MDIQAYIESGILQDYCLGVLTEADYLEVEKHASVYPEINNELRLYQHALEQYATDFASRTDVAGIKAKTLDVLDNLLKEKAYSGDLPLLNRFSTREHWLRVVKPMIPEKLEKEMFVKVLRNDGQVFQSILWLRTAYPDEIHDDLKECFMILEGECECYMDGKVIRLGPGGFFDIPLHVHHDVKVTKGPVLAIIQRLKVA